MRFETIGVSDLKILIDFDSEGGCCLAVFWNELYLRDSVVLESFPMIGIWLWFVPIPSYESLL